MSAKLLVFRDLDGTWSVVRGDFSSNLSDLAFPDAWVAEGVGSWERAMRIVNETARR